MTLEETKETKSVLPEAGEPRYRSPVQPSRIAVDMTPFLPGGENGGAKVLTIELVRHLGKLAPECHFILLTSDLIHEEISFLDAPNVTRFCVKNESPSVPPPSTVRQRKKIRFLLKEWLSASLPLPFYRMLKTGYVMFRSHRLFRTRTLRDLGVDLLFCPLNIPFYYDPAVPVVSVIYDLQFQVYPQFFEAEDRLTREINFKETCRLSKRLVCISEYVRSTVLEHSGISPETVVTIPIRLFDRLQKPKPETTKDVLQKHGLVANEFLLYPANFWPHKNHSMLFTAFGMFRSRHPKSELKLVCTGAPNERLETLGNAVLRMGLQAHIHLPGFLSEPEFAVFMASCRGLIFPSLHEGFGMPLLEAMAFGKPVLCSNATSLPEVGGDAAIYFDPRKPEQIAEVFRAIDSNSELLSRLVEGGKERLSSFGNTAQMASDYMSVFQEAAE
ncbi:MAG: glycosyltransferase family 4 protein [Deltaproteobacteria bacterium]|nr:glycosyltransferase family 4 protein [Deltaproteobacteria bacterium]